MIDGLWAHGDGDRIAVDRDGQVTIIDTSATQPDGTTFECMPAADLGVNLSDGSWTEMHDPVDSGCIPLEQA